MIMQLWRREKMEDIDNIEVVQQAIVDLMDGQNASDIVAFSGMPINRAEGIYNIYNTILNPNKSSAESLKKINDIKILQSTLAHLLDGQTEDDLVAFSGISIKRAEAIYNLGQSN